MLGKLSSLVSYWKVLEVYTLKRFPSNKLPLFGMVFTYTFLSYFLYSKYRDSRTASMKVFRLRKEEKNINEWSFNQTRDAYCSS